jgi:hypothetical protein
LSLRFWTFASTAFGLSGSLMLAFGVADLIAALIATPLGLMLGWLVSAAFRALRSDRVTSETGVAHLEGSEARVVLTVRPGGLGKITLHSQGARLELPARTSDGVELEPGATVIVAGVGPDGVADVTGSAPGRARGATSRRDHA